MGTETRFPALMMGLRASEITKSLDAQDFVLSMQIVVGGGIL